ncbi:SGNH/GDSL hydrolase family protein [Mycoplasmopsis hyopharyngis]|uniref:SGNH/GDSL hydrolase family protein n=1 Tax=Mycoplasmopsis hyopharyngis TaxID=29558 RepID=UPI003873BE20
MQKSSVRLLALGDSIAQGFNSKIGCGSCGYKNGQEFVSGYSYTDYFALLLKNYCLENNKEQFWNNFDYYNFSASVMRINDISNLLSQNLEASNDFYNLIKINKDIEQIANVKVQNNIWQVDDSLSEKEIFTINSNRLIEQVKNSDVITISIGGNEYQCSFPFNLIKRVINEPNIYKQLKIKEELFEELKRISQTITLQYRKMLSQIRTLNPNAQIILLSYIPPFLSFLVSYENILKSINPIVYQDLFKEINLILNKTICDSRIDEKCHYLKIFKFDFWKNHTDILCENLFDVHPTELGYKEIARVLFTFFIDKKLIFSDSNFKYLKKLNKLSLKKLDKRFNELEKKQIKIFKMPKNINHIIYILRAWLERKNNVQNPYFALFKRETREFLKNYDSKNMFIRHEDYTSLSSIFLEKLFFILKLFPSDSQLTLFIKNNIATDENIIYFFKFLFNNETIFKILIECESIYKANKKQKLGNYLNNIFYQNKENIFLLFKDWLSTLTLDSKQNFNKMIELLNQDFKNHNSLILEDNSMSKLINSMSFSKDIVEQFEKLTKLFVDFLQNNNIWKNKKMDDFFQYFIIEYEQEIKKLIRFTVEHIALFSIENREDFSYIITNFLKINQEKLSFKEWKYLNKIMNKIHLLLKQKKVIKYIENVLYKILKKLNIHDIIDFRKITKFKAMKIIIRQFSKTIMFNVFGKTNLKIFSIACRMFWLKVRHKIRIF